MRLPPLLALVLALAAGSLAAVRPARAAAGDPVWSRGLGVNGHSASVDAGGHVYIAGTFAGSVDFGSGLVTAVTSGDVFIAKYAPDGSLEWANHYPPSQFVQVTAVAAQPSGGVYVAGVIPKGGTIDFGGGPLGTTDGFGVAWMVKLDALGAHVFSDEYGRGVINDIDASNTEVAVAARNSGTMNFGGADLGVTNGPQAIAAKLTGAGAHVWSDEYGDAAVQSGLNVGLEPGGVVVLLAAVRGTIDFGAGALVADANDDMALARFDAAGNALWSRLDHGTFGSSSLLSSGLDLSATGEIAVAGEFVGTLDFGGGVLTATAKDLFAARFDSNGNHLWSQRWGGAGDEGATAIAYEPGGALTLTGTYRSTFDFGGPPLGVTGAPDVFVASLSLLGAHRWSRGIGSAGFESRPRVEVDGPGAAILSLTTGGSVDLGGGALVGSFAFGKYAGDVPSTGVPGPAGAGQGLALDVAPNPLAGGGAAIRFSAPASARATLEVLDAAGRRVRRYAGPAAGRIEWDGRDHAGARVAPGLYFVRLATGAGSLVRRLAVVR